MEYPFAHIAEIVGGQIIQQSFPSLITNILTDSRHIAFPDQSLFIAIDGQQHDGHQFIQDCHKAGVNNFLISKSNITLPNGVNAILIDDGLTALQALATHHRLLYENPVVGITGSNGKTIVKEWLYQLLKDQLKVIRSPRSYNSQLGVPLSILLIEKQHEIALIEAGISQSGEMEKLAMVIEPTLGILTNIGSAHDAGFSDAEEKTNEKLKLFSKVHCLVYRSDNPIVNRILSQKNIPCLSWSTENEKADFHIQEISQTSAGCKLTGFYQNVKKSILIPFTDKASIENAIHCWALLLYLKIPDHTIMEGMIKLDPVGMRLQLIEGVNGCVVINDSYNSDLQSLRIALDVMSHQKTQLKRTVILSDIMQSRQNLDQLYREVAQYLKEKNVNRLIGIGKEITQIIPHLPEHVQRQFYSKTQTFLDQIKLQNFRDEVVLIKGARHYEFEKISNLLERKLHKTILEVDLSALAFNLNVFRGYLKEGTKLMVMVKAFAYGSGLEVAKMLAFHKVDYLAVAYVDEGIEIRNAGVETPIMIMNADKDSISSMIEYQFEPQVYSLTFLRQLISYTTEKEVIIPVHLKIDTGMNRLGFDENQLEEVIQLLQMHPWIRVCSILTHLAASDNKEHDQFSSQQVQKFNLAFDRMAGLFNEAPMAHVLNTAGIVRFPQWQMDMVRLGVGLYGIDSSGTIRDLLKPALTLKAIVSQIKQVHSGDSIGYGRMGKTVMDMKTATVSVGYADGLPRSAGNGNYSLLIRGKKATIVGNVCMDMCMVDVTKIEDVCEGDEVIVYGPGHPVEILAESIGTIPYELFTRIPERVKRVYIQD